LAATAIAGSSSLSPGILPQQKSALNSSSLSEHEAPQIVSIADAAGSIWLKRGSSKNFETAKIGASIQAGDTLKTGEGFCRLSLENNTSVWVSPNTIVTINEAALDRLKNARSTTLNLEIGKLKAKIGKLHGESRFQITTPTAVASVRGTTLYINAGTNGNNQGFTTLFVDESDKGVDFKNNQTGDEKNVGDNQLSETDENGNVSDPDTLSEEEGKEFTENWEEEMQKTSSDGAQNENQENQSSSSGEEEVSDEFFPDDPLNPDFQPLDDAALDKQSEQNTNSEAAQNAAAEDFEEQENQGQNSPTDPTTEQERLIIAREIARIRSDIDFERADANLAQISDRQTGKVFTDAFGNRVRTDQYIFHEPSSDTVQFLSLTLRTGDYQNGVSSLLFKTQFNRGIGPADGLLKDLPWQDYLNVVEKDEFFNRSVEPYDINKDFSQYIIHENDAPLQGPNPLYPVKFNAEFSNPIDGRSQPDIIRFEEEYSNLFSADLGTGTQDSYGQWEGTRTVQAQGNTIERSIISPSGQPTIEMESTRTILADPQKRSYVTHLHTLKIGGQAINNYFVGDQGGAACVDCGDGPQTAGFSTYFNANRQIFMGPDAVNEFRNHPLNNDADHSNDIKPAHFSEEIFILDASSQSVLSTHVLGGIFLPITDSGQVIDAPGFNLRGMRDLLNPHALVNGGNYNLEVLLFYGNYELDASGTPTGFFNEQFRIDTIITPEIFQGFGNGVGGGENSLFPRGFEEEDPQVFLE
jgi:hypothetical protein